MAEIVPPDGYRVIYADPPWTFKTHSAKGKGRSAEAHYDCMGLAEIKRMVVPIAEVCAKDCVLLLWATDPFLEKAFEVIKAWGFTYKTVGFYWAKTIRPTRISTQMACAAVCADVDERDPGDPEVFPIGTGYWSRANPEQCLLATWGHPKRLHADVRKLIVSPRREHSRKPDEIYDRIERLCAGPYLEMFGRFDRPGWDRWGIEDGIGPRRWRSDMAEQVRDAG